jgi:hypothetical protein
MTIAQRQQKNQTRDEFERGTPKGLEFKKRHRVQQKCNNGMKD